MISLLAVKLLCALGMFLICSALSVCPTIIHNRLTFVSHHGEKILKGKSKKIVAALSCFGGGVFLATFFLGMLSEIREKFERWFEETHYHNEFPFHTLLCISGFLLIMIIEHTAIEFHKRSQHKKEKRSVSFNETQITLESKYKRSKSENGTATTKPETVPLAERGENDEKIDRSTSNASTYKRVQSAVALERALSEKKERKAVTSTLHAIVLLMAFSFHAVFEGLALGLMSTSEKTITFFLGLAFHEGIVAFCLGLNLTQSNMKRWVTILSCFLYAIMNPIGLIIGCILSQEENKSFATEAILQSIASGTFLYVIFVEIIPREFVHDAMQHEHEFFGNDEEDDDDTSRGVEFGADDEFNNHNDLHKLFKVFILSCGIGFMATIIGFTHH